jgi:hypothetical protein
LTAHTEAPQVLHTPDGEQGGCNMSHLEREIEFYCARARINELAIGDYKPHHPEPDEDDLMDDLRAMIEWFRRLLGRRTFA